MSNAKKQSTDLTQLAGLDVVFKSRKAGMSVPVEITELPQSSIEAIIRYGAQRFINDKLGGSDISAEEAAKQFQTILDQLREGWVDRRGTGGGGAPVDPVEKEAQRMARDRIKAALRQKGIPMKQVPKEKMAELVQGIMERNGKELREKAAEIVAVQSSTLDGVDLGDLDL